MGGGWIGDTGHPATSFDHRDQETPSPPDHGSCLFRHVFHDLTVALIAEGGQLTNQSLDRLLRRPQGPDRPMPAGAVD